MVFTTPPWVPSLSFDPPDSVPIHQFQFEEEHGRCQFRDSRNPFTCGLSAKTRSPIEVKARIEYLAKGIGKVMGWAPNTRSEWEKVVSVYSMNHIDYMVLGWAVHRLNGILTPASAACSALELEHQLRDSRSQAIFTCESLLPTAIQAATAAGLSEKHVYLLEPSNQIRGSLASLSWKSLDELVLEGMNEPPLEELHWESGQGARQVAYLCYSSGTSGPPKGVEITHRNIIANVLQLSALDSTARDTKRRNMFQTAYNEACLGVLPMSHAYAITIWQLSTYRGDGVIVFPNFDLRNCFEAISRYQIRTLWLVPAILELFMRNHDLLCKFDVNSVTDIVAGAAPLSNEKVLALQELFPKWRFRQGYGLTEACTVICWTPDHDIMPGSVGCLLPGIEAKIISSDSEEISQHNVPGELLVRSPSVSIGYHNDAESTKQTFADGWLHTGDKAMVCVSPLGYEHLVITDRVKDLIKVRGYQVSPSELESLLLTHPDVSDCCVVSVPDALSGEVPKAFIVRKQKAGDSEFGNYDLQCRIQKYVDENMAEYKRLKGGVEFVAEIPRGAGGKLLRRILRQENNTA
ncbi:acetyl-CoA synthetase-like protein [Periconia macrospinosa]|uniref:Acetyl-CoA synthetase-like protein n=1 Tax=Periconia macrospinosa TaxID=97972 RepID=A0A2V1CX53_9PLEO|nr:acetyl-CoA synthetase-like protein [Periconia macrospinosa]